VKGLNRRSSDPEEIPMPVSSTEKSRTLAPGAEILFRHLSLGVNAVPDLGENDR